MSEPTGPADDSAASRATTPPFAPMDGAGPTDDGAHPEPTTQQFEPFDGVALGGAAARLADAPPPGPAPQPAPFPPSGPPAPPPPQPAAPGDHDDLGTRALGVVQPAPAGPPPGPGAPPPAAPGAAPVFDPNATYEGPLPGPVPAWGAGTQPHPFAIDGGPPTVPGPVLDPTPTAEQPASPWYGAAAGGAVAGGAVVGADAMAAGTGVRPPGAPTFQPPPPPPPGALPPPPPPHAGGAAPSAGGGGGGKASSWILAALLVAALVAVVLLVVRGSSLTDERDEAVDEADELAAEIDALEDERDALQEEIDALEEEGSSGTLPPDLAELEEELAARQAAIEALEDELEAREEELDEREDQLDQREEELDQREDELGEGSGDGDLTAVLDLEVGECVADPPDPTTGLPAEVVVVDCDDPHQGEVYAETELTATLGSAFPGDAAVAEAAIEFCGGSAFLDAFGATPAETGLLPVPRLPGATDWIAGDGVVLCTAFAEDGSDLVGSLADS